MADLSQIDKLKLETIFGMGTGYVLDFSNSSIQRFIYGSIKLNIDDQKYLVYGGSKANRLRYLWEAEPNAKVGKLIEDMLQYYETQKVIKGNQINFNKQLFEECSQIANRLQGKIAKPKHETEAAFLKTEVDEIEVSSLNIDSSVAQILQYRINETKKCIKNDAPLAAIFLCGSILEGILLSIASRNSKEFNQSSVSPKNLQTGKVKQFHEWSLSNFIDVAYDIRYLGLDVKKYSHALRDFRNYIHPYEQMSSGFQPDRHTAEISWKVLKAAMHDLHTKS